ncbi:MAG: HD domain-containing protein [Chloroflexi bacterium]|nr:HD domain-containing protein [Chloroflexota bacterium]
MLLDNLPNASTQLNAILKAFPDFLLILDERGFVLDYKADDSIFPFASKQFRLGQSIASAFPPDVAGKFQQIVQDLKQTPAIQSFEYSVKLQQTEHWFDAKFIPVEPAQVIVVIREITRHKLAEERTQRQLNRLAALRAIDLAISSTLDIHLALSVVLSQVTSQLNVDAADILLLNPQNNLLEFANGVGFRTESLQQTRLPLGEGYAGMAALRRQVISVPNLQRGKTGFLRSPKFAEEGFHSYYCVPLIAKGHVRGVMEVFHRTPLTPDLDWFDFMETLAGQAAIAVENATLFRELQRTNFELTLAYNTTIEGWSRALDLRDRDTEGHTRRVTEMALKLARRLGVSEAELVNVQRGAILHDIGKMAIPDNILLKSGPLSAEEWNIIRQHPRYARELLSPISFVRPALDIPMYHHEKWDGTGYPGGLKENQIPLYARLFAVADVYDALTSNRPYRPAWTKEQAIVYIREQSGKHFDPDMVNHFLKMITDTD